MIVPLTLMGLVQFPGKGVDLPRGMPGGQGEELRPPEAGQLVPSNDAVEWISQELDLAVPELR